MLKIGVTNQKGGVGKTTLVFHLSYLFSRSNKKTTVIDMDPQGNLTSCFTEDLPEKSNIKLIFEGNFPEPIPINKNLSIIGADITLSKYEAEAKLANFFKLRNLLDQLNGDVILIDTPPSLGLFTSNVLIAVNHILVPADISKFSLSGLSDLLDSIENIKESTKSKIDVIGILFAFTNIRMNYSKAIRKEAESKYKDLLFDTVIPESVKVKEAISKKQPVFDLYPKHKTSIAYKEFFNELERRLYGKR